MKYLISLFLALISASAFASNYPADYCDTHARVYSDNAVVVSRVGSGCGSSYVVIGYRTNGFVKSNNDLTAVVIPVCTSQYENRGTYEGATQVVTVGREWNGKGHITFPLTFRCEGSSYLTGIKVAFSDNKGNWDSKYGQNYFFNFNNREERHFQTREVAYNGSLPKSVWDFLLSEMY